MAHDDTYAWLDSPLVADWLKISLADDDPRTEVLEQCRLAAAEWVEAQRPDLVSTEVADAGEFTPTPRIVQGALLAVARLYARKDSPNGVVSFEELGAGSLLKNDPDVRRMIGLNKSAAMG